VKVDPEIARNTVPIIRSAGGAARVPLRSFIAVYLQAREPRGVLMWSRTTTGTRPYGTVSILPRKSSRFIKPWPVAIGVEAQRPGSIRVTTVGAG